MFSKTIDICSDHCTRECMDQTLIFKNYVTNKELVFKNVPKTADFFVTMEIGVWLNMFNNFFTW